MSERNSKTTPKASVATLGLVLLASTGCFDSSSDDGELAWASPDCESVAGDPSVSFSPDAGETVIPTEEDIDGDDGSGDPVGRRMVHALEMNGSIASSSGGQLIVSRDSGCSWSSVDDAPQASRLVGNDESFFFRVTEIEQNEISYGIRRVDRADEVSAIEPHEGIIDLATTSDDASAVYGMEVQDPAAGTGAGFWRGGRQGNEWFEQAGDTEVGASSFYVNPNDARHFLIPADGVVINSFDGGSSWQDSEALADDDAESTQILRIHIGGMPGQEEIWAFGRHEFDSADSEEPYSEFFALSVDGGMSFEELLRFDIGTARGHGGSVMTTRAGVTGELYFTLGGCSLYRFDVDEGLTEFSWHERDTVGVDGVMAHPTDPDVIYIGNRYQACD